MCIRDRPCTVRGIKPEVRVAVVVELHPLPASDTRIGPVHRDASVAAVYRDMRVSEGRSPDHPAADFSFGEGTAQAVDIVRVDDGGPDAGGIELRGRLKELIPIEKRLEDIFQQVTQN